ncbi:hypothetical protein H8356DRAFT_1623189, partial [Neocallimastix lanati (nom. inval.)]
MTKSDNSTVTGSSSKTSSKTTKTTNTSSTTMNDTLVEVEPPNIQTNTINKFHIQNFRITNVNFHKWHSDLKLFLDSEELGDYISKNIKDINTNKKHLKYDSTVRIIILNSLDEYTKSLLNNCTSAYL